MNNNIELKMTTAINKVLGKFFLIALLAFVFINQAQAEIEEIDSVVAVVNNDIITKLELKSAFKTIVNNLRRQGKNPPPAQILTKKVMDKMIMEKIQLDLAERSGILKNETTLNRSILKMAEQNGLTLSDFITTLKEQGIDYALFRQDMQRQIILRRLQQRFVDSKVIITEQDIDSYLFNYKNQIDANKVYHPAIILVSIPEGSSSENIDKLQEKANMIYQKLQEGNTFSNTAIEFSDAGNALEGGDLGWRKVSELPSMIADITPTLEIGEFSKPKRTPIGFMIVKLLETKSSLQHEIQETHAQHILIKTDLNTTTEQAKAHLNALRIRLLAGEEFSTLAKAHSDDKVSAADGGNLGWFKPGTMVPEFDKALTNLAVSEISQIVETAFGFHLIKLLERRKRDDSEEFIRSKIKTSLREKEITEKKLYWLRRIRDEAHIEIKRKAS